MVWSLEIHLVFFLHFLFVVSSCHSILICIVFFIFCISSYCLYHNISSHFIIHIIAFAFHCIIREMELYMDLPIWCLGYYVGWPGISFMTTLLDIMPLWLIYLLWLILIYRFIHPSIVMVLFIVAPCLCYGCTSREGFAVYSFVAGPHESSLDDYFVLWFSSRYL